jgi:HAD superfamily hydrolase (TIGR01549 family)
MNPAVYQSAALPPGFKPRALILDVDGTMYDGAVLRRRMAWSLLRAFGLRPLTGWRTLRVLQAYHDAQEEIRREQDSDTSAVSADLANRQLELASRRSGCDPELAGAWVRRWFEEAPLQELPHCASPDLMALVKCAKAAGIFLGACSDYPAREKLRALGILEFFDAVVCAQEAGSFKPGPGGLLRTLEELGAPAECALYAGDRPDVDGQAAARAGVRFVQVVHRGNGGSSGALTLGELLGWLTSRVR